MPTSTEAPLAHEHVFLGHAHDANERRTWVVVALTAAMMAGEIVAGSVFNSMALVQLGPLVEDEYGTERLAAIYVLCGIAGSAASGGPSSPTTSATSSTVASTPGPTSTAQKVEPK